MEVAIGLFGLGRHGRRYARHIAQQDIEGVRLAGVWTRDPDKAARVARETGARAFPRAEDLADAPFDAAIMAVPAGLHHRLALLLAANARPLLLEKPLARTLHEATSIVEAFENAGIPLMVAQTLRFDPLTRALREATPGLGRWTGFGFEQRIEPRGLPWEDDPKLAGGGVLVQTGIHTLDTLRFVTGAELTVLGAWANRVGYRHQEDVAHVVLAARPPEPGPPVLGDIRVSKISRARLMRFGLLFAEGSIEADFIDRELTVTEGTARRRRTIPAEPTVVRVVEAFAAHLRGGDNPVPGRDALTSMAVVDAACTALRDLHRPDVRDPYRIGR